MSEGQELPPWAKPKAPPPEARPTWVVVLALLMLMFGGRFVVMGASQLSTGSVEPALDDATAAQLPPERRVFGEAMARASHTYPSAVQANAVAKLALGALLLFAVAAVFSSDGRARRATLIAAWAGIVFQLGDGLFLFLVSRHELAAIAPTLLAGSPGSGGQPMNLPPSVLMIVMMVLGLPGILFSLVLLRFFGGPRGRTFFGVRADADARPT